MVIEILIVWLIIFALFLLVNLSQNSLWFGIFAGIILLLLGLAIILTGIQIQNGMTIVTSGGTQTIEYTQENLTQPFYPYGGVQSSYSLVWGVPLLLIAIFMIYSNGEKV